MRIVDTHSHIYQPEFDNDVDEVVNRAKMAGVEKILLPNIDVSTIERVHALSGKYSGYCMSMMGLHPTSVGENWQSDLKEISACLEKHSYIAIGEIGIDLYWDKTFEKEQKYVFEEQLRWSAEYKLPVAIHSRNAIPECIQCIQNVGAERLRGVFHSFGGNEEEMNAIFALENFYLGINGVVTFKNSSLPTVLKAADIARVIVETDAPYLAPVPYRGKRNEPSYTVNVINKLAEIFSLSPEETGYITSENAYRLFNMDK